MKKKIIWFFLSFLIVFNLIMILSVFTLVRPVYKSANDSAIIKALKKIMPTRNLEISLNDLKHTKIYLKTSDNVKIETMIFADTEELINIDNKFDTPIIIFLHGYGHPVNASEKKRIQFLRKHRAPVIAPHFRGYSESGGIYTYVGVREFTEVQTLLRFIASNYPNKKIIIFGISMGAAAGLKALYNFQEQSLTIPNLCGLIIEGCYFSLENAVENRLKIQKLPTALIHFLKFWAAIIFNLDVNANTPFKYANIIDNPVLFLAGTNDFKTDPLKMRALFSLFKNQYKYIEISNAEHHNVYEINPKLYEKEVIDFILKIK